MGDVSSGAKAWLRCGQFFSGLANRAFRLLFSLTLAVAVFLAVTIPPAHAAGNHGEAVVEHPSNDLHDKAPCDEGFVCSAYILLERIRDGFSNAEYRILLISLEVPLRNFSPPQVDLPPPRAAA